MLISNRGSKQDSEIRYSQYQPPVASVCLTISLPLGTKTPADKAHVPENPALTPSSHRELPLIARHRRAGLPEETRIDVVPDLPIIRKIELQLPAQVETMASECLRCLGLEPRTQGYARETVDDAPRVNVCSDAHIVAP